MMDDEKILVTEDGKKMTEGEREMLTTGPMITTGPMMEIKSVDALMELARMAKERKDGFDDSISKKMTKERALRVKELRTESSWRSVAAQTFLDWGEDADWYPESNQLAGMSLCEQAAQILGDDYSGEPWN